MSKLTNSKFQFSDEEICAKVRELWKAKNIDKRLSPEEWVQEIELRKEKQLISKEEWSNAIKSLLKEKDWTGFRDKKLWDFIQLLLAPILLTFLGFGFQYCSKQNEQQAADRKTENELKATNDRNKQETLTKYLDGMSDLLQKGLLSTKRTDPTFIIAQSKTVITLRSLDSARQNLIFQFLESAELNSLGKDGILFRAKMAKAKLSKADFTKTKLIQADLQESDLTSANLTGADLRSIDLENANLSQADMYDADLRRAVLVLSNLTNASLASSDLTMADFKFSTLQGTSLKRAILNKVDLSRTKYLTKEQLDISLDTKNRPYICNVQLPSNIINLIPKEERNSYLKRDCEALVKKLLERYPRRYKRILMKYPNRFKDENEAAIFDRDNPECITLYT